MDAQFAYGQKGLYGSYDAPRASVKLEVELPKEKMEDAYRALTAQEIFGKPLDIYIDAPDPHRAVAERAIMRAENAEKQLAVLKAKLAELTK